MFSVQKLISGGQTGVDRAALDAAIACGVPHGGRCPKGRRAEDGSIPATYHLQEMEVSDYPSRTKANVDEADLTVIISRGPLTGGSLLTQQFAEDLGKPCFHFDLDRGFQALEKLPEMFPTLGRIVLNVAGPRASNAPEVYADVRACLDAWLPRVQSN